jgi:hypothetical protein
MEDPTLCMSIKGIACPIDRAWYLDGEGKKIPDPGRGLISSVSSPPLWPNTLREAPIA